LAKGSNYKFLGLDLAGSFARPTGWALIDENAWLCVQPGELFEDEEILGKIEKIKPEWIGIDAPLNFPKGSGKMRFCDRELRRFGSPALSPFLIASVTKRGIKLSKILRKRGYRCIEVYPRATQRILRIKTEGKKSSKTWRILCQRGISRWIEGIPAPEESIYSSHILDAVLCAYTAYCRWRGCYEEIGDEEGRVVVPSPC